MIIYFDLETQNMSYEVGGWWNLEAVRLAVGCTWDEDNSDRTWWEQQAVDLAQELMAAELIIGFNVNKFDYRVLTLYSDLADYLSTKTFDILREVRNQGLPLVGLDTLAGRNFGGQKSYKSADAVDLWRLGRLDELERYCQQDVKLIRDLIEHWEKTGLLWLDDQRYAVWPGLHVTESYWGDYDNT